MAVGTAQVAPALIFIQLNASGQIPGATNIYFSDELTPSGTTYTASVVAAGGGLVWGAESILVTGASFNFSTAIPTTGNVVLASPVITNPSAQQTINGFPLVLEGASLGFSAAGSTVGDSWLARVSSSNLALGTTPGGTDANLTLNNVITQAVKQVANNFFSILDGNGLSRFFLSNTSPYVNTFINGNGAGVVFLGSAGKTQVADTTGTIATAGGLVLQTTAQTLPATMTNDTAGGLLFTNNAGKTLQFGNGGTLFLGSSGSRGQGIGFFGATSGDAGVLLDATGGTSSVITIPNTTDRLVAQALAQTLTNKRITPRLITTTSAANAPVTLTADSDNDDINAWVLTGTAGTLTIAAPSGTPTDGQKLILRIKTTNAWTYSFNATFAFSTSVTAPTTTGAGKTDYIGCMWNATNTKWDVTAVDQGH